MKVQKMKTKFRRILCAIFILSIISWALIAVYALIVLIINCPTRPFILFEILAAITVVSLLIMIALEDPPKPVSDTDQDES